MAGIFLAALKETLITGAVIFLMMVFVELVNIGLRGRLPRLIGEGRPRGYLVAACLGVLPGCAGGYLAVTLYGHGALTFGAVVAAMIATSGDEAFVMLGQFPGPALALFSGMLVTGLIVGALTDLIATSWGVPASRECAAPAYHPGHEDVSHFLREHVVRHILLKHLPRILLWTFPALVLSEGLARLWEDGEPPMALSGSAMVVLGAVWGLIPSSGPHLVFVELFSKGLAPLSSLASNSISQTGHDILPLLAISLRDAAWVKLICLVAAIMIGLGLLLFGL